MGLREIYDHPSFDKGDSNKGSGSSERHEVKEHSDGGGEIGKPIEVRDSTARSSRENVDTKEQHSTPEIDHTDKPDTISLGRDRENKNPTDKEHNIGSSEKQDRTPNSYSAKIADRTDYILRKGYVEDRDQITNLIRCGNTTCKSFGPPKQGKELKDIGKEILKKIEKAAGKAVFNKATNPYKAAAKAMLKPTPLGNDDTDMEKIVLELDMFILKNEHPEIIKKYNEFHLERFPDLKTPEEINNDQLKQRNDYFDYNIY